MLNYTTLNRPLGAEAPSTPWGPAGISNGSDHTSPEVPSGLPGTWFPPLAYPFEVSVAGEQYEADSDPTQTRSSSGSFKYSV
ncbi:hypothetical protein ABHI18_011951, partial [Aspergillus niger]